MNAKSLKPQLRKMLATTLMMLAAFATLQAQDRPGPQNKQRGERMEQLLDKLELSDQQREQVKALQEEFRQEFMEFRQEMQAGPDPQKRQQRRELMEKHQAELMEILSPEQRARLESLREERQASRRERMEKMREAHKPMREEMQSFHRETVRPAIQELRADFDRVLTENERVEIEAIRQKMREFRKEHRSDSLQHHGRKGRHGQLGEQQQQQREVLQTQFAEEFKTLEGIADKYKSELDAVRQKMDELQKEWREEREEIREQFMKESADSLRHHRGRHRAGAEAEQGHGHHGKHHEEGRAGKRPELLFLLMSPDASSHKLEREGGIKSSEAENANFRVFPNPAGNSATVSYTLERKGPVLIELLDPSGRVERKLFEGEQEAGTHSLQFELPASIAKGAVVRLNDASGSRSLNLLRQ